jgi:hypothetical protein
MGSKYLEYNPGSEFNLFSFEKQTKNKEKQKNRMENKVEQKMKSLNEIRTTTK